MLRTLKGHQTERTVDIFSQIPKIIGNKTKELICTVSSLVFREILDGR